MNERIKELIEKATVRGEEYLPGNDGHPTPTFYFDKEKFAELIVKECARACEYDEAPKMIDPLTAEQHALIAQGRHTAAYLVKQHFGVRE